MKKIIFWTVVIVLVVFLFTPAKTILMNKNQKDIYLLKKYEKHIHKTKNESELELWYDFVKEILDKTDSDKVQDKAYEVLEVYRAKTKSFEKDRQELRDITIYNIAKENISSKLKSPSTAKFQPLIDIQSEYKEGFFYMSIWVDAQNSFGATVREQYTVKYKAEGDNVYLISIE
jgi:hypothetical protein